MNRLLVPSLFEGDIFEAFFDQRPLNDAFGRDPYDIWVDEDGSTVIDYSLVGFDEKNIKVVVSGDRLKIDAETEDKKSEEGSFVHKKISRRNVHKTFSLRNSVDKSAIQASYKNGLLSIRLPQKKDEELEVPINLS